MRFNSDSQRRAIFANLMRENIKKQRAEGKIDAPIFNSDDHSAMVSDAGKSLQIIDPEMIYAGVIHALDTDDMVALESYKKQFGYFSDDQKSVLRKYLGNTDSEEANFIRDNLFARRKLYHGTAGLRGYAISKEGLIPPSEKGESFGCGGEFSDPNCVYLTGDKEAAKVFAKAMSEKFGGKPYVFGVEADPLQENEFYIDLEFPDSWKHKGGIPKEKLKEINFSKDPKFVMPDNIENPQDYVPVKVNVEKFKEYWKRNPDNYFEKDSVALHDRYEGVLEEVKKSDKIYMPEVYAKPGVRPGLDTIDVPDGRHRSAAIIERGLKEMKIAVPDFQKEWFEERLGA